MPLADDAVIDMPPPSPQTPPRRRTATTDATEATDSSSSSSSGPSTAPPSTPGSQWPRRGLALFLSVLALAAVVVGPRFVPKKKMVRVAAASVAIRTMAADQEGCRNNYVIRLWPEGQVPMARPDMETAGQAPTLTAFIPLGTSVVIVPGGSYDGLADYVEGTPYARWLCGQGIPSYVLHYRHSGTGDRTPVPELDGRRALRLVRSRLRPGVDDANKVGMVGSSAGGHLTSTVLAYNDKGDAHAADPVEQLSSRPDFGVLVYPLITMEDGVTFACAKSNLFGPDLTPFRTQFLTQKYSTEKHIDHTFPPTFVYAPKDDDVVPVENTYRLIRALEAAKVPHETAIYEHGRHGEGLGDGSILTEEGELVNGRPWTAQCLRFLARVGMLRGGGIE